VKVSVFVGTSLDGFIARTDGALDFLPPGGGASHGYEEFLASVDAAVMGRRTYDALVGFDEWPYGKKPVFVLSHRPLDAVPPGAVLERLSGAPAAISAELEERAFRHIYLDGGLTIQQFLAAGLVHRLVITRVPVLIGTGIALFGPLPRDLPLRHVATRPYPSGLVQSEYVVAAA
jgi:dihydrofolate reductase